MARVKKKAEYTAEDIDVLEGLEPVRKSPGMFLGEASTQVLRAFREIYENSVDVFSKGMNDFISVVLDGDKLPQTYTVIDHGPGIPVEKHKKTGISTLSTIFLYLHAGSNFDKNKKEKSISRGVHGVGSSCTCACSENFVVWTNRDKQWYTQAFSKGKPTSPVEKCKFPTKFQKYGAKRDCGTIIQFTPDYTILPKTLIKEDELFSFVKENADLNKGLTVRFISQKRDETIQNKRGIIAVLEDFIESKKKVNVLGKPFVFESENLDVALQWSDLEGENVQSYVNLAQTQNGGTHVQGLFDAITKAFKDAAKRGDDFTASDLREGLIAVIHYKCNDDDYSGQNKEKLNTVSAVKIVKEALSKPLEKWIKSNSKLVREISVRATQIKKAKAEAKAITKAASTLKGSNKKKGQLLGSKLIQCSKKCKPEDIELILVEGNSASGTASQARDSSFQEVLKCRGKGLNVFRTTLAKALANVEISSLLVALGADEKKIRKGEKITTFRVGKILLFSDPDIDASHIDALWLTWIYNFAPAAFEKKMVYKVNVPLYQAMWCEKGEDKRCFGYSLKEIEKKAPKNAHVTRFKGLGELNPNQLQPFMDPETRNLTLITLPKAKNKIERFIKIMGDDVQTRKEILGISPRKGN